MFERLHRQMTLFCAAVTGIILVVMTLLCLFLSEASIRQNHYQSFLNELNSVISYLENQTVISNQWLAKTEDDNRLVLDVYDNGAPLLYNSLAAIQPEREKLVEQAKRQAAEEYGLDISLPVSNSVLSKYTEFSNEVIKNVGGKENISGVVHCMTRLRLNVKDKSKVNVEAVKEVKGAIGAQFSGEQFQIIIGQHVSEIYPEFCEISGIEKTKSIEENLDKEPFDFKKIPGKVLDFISGSIAPILPIMMGAGLFKMLYAMLGPDLFNVMNVEHPFMKMISIVGNCGFYFMPIFVAWSTAKKVNTSIPMALLLGALLIDPNILSIVTTGEPFKMYGILSMPLVNYAQTLLPTLLTVWVLQYVFKFFDNVIPKSFKIMGVPFCTLFIMIPLMFCGLAPIGNWLGEGMSWVITTLYDVAGPLAIALVSAVFPFLIATGMHVAVGQIGLVNMTTAGFDPVVFVGMNIAYYAMSGMIVAYLIRAKGEEKQMAGVNAVTLIVGGISEPTIFGVLVRNKKAMIVQVIGSAIAGLVGGFLGVTVYSFGATNFMTILQFAGGPGQDFINACIACGIAFIVPLVLGLMIGFLSLIHI